MKFFIILSSLLIGSCLSVPPYDHHEDIQHGGEHGGLVNTGHSAQFRSDDGHGNFEWGYNEDHATGGTFRKEKGGPGYQVGSYGLRDADGRIRIVHYIADAHGFRASVSTNEPGVDVKQDPAATSLQYPGHSSHVPEPLPVAHAPIEHAPIAHAPEHHFYHSSEQHTAVAIPAPVPVHHSPSHSSHSSYQEEQLPLYQEPLYSHASHSVPIASAYVPAPEYQPRHSSPDSGYYTPALGGLAAYESPLLKSAYIPDHNQGYSSPDSITGNDYYNLPSSSHLSSSSHLPQIHHGQYGLRTSALNYAPAVGHNVGHQGGNYY